MRRKLNVKFALCLLAGLIVASGGMALAHHLQYSRMPLAFLKQAQRAESEKDYRRVDDYLTRYLAFAPDDLEQKARLATILANPKYPGGRGQAARAYFLLQGVLANDPERHDLRRLLIPIAIDMRRTEDAADQLKLLPQDAETSSLWGRWYEAKGQTEEAIESYRESLARDPSNVETTVNFTKLLRSRRWDRLSREEGNRKRQADAEEAEKALDDLVKTSPESWQALVARWNYQREYVLRARKNEAWSATEKLARGLQVAEAARDVDRALELREGEPDVRLAAAEAAQLLDNLDLARTHLDRARQLHRKDPRIYKSYAGLELQVEQTLTNPVDKRLAREKAIAWLRQGARELTQPAQFELQWALASLLLDTGTPKELEEAGPVIAKVRGTNVTPAGADYLQGRLLMGRQQWAEAAKLLDRSRLPLESAPDLATQIDLLLGNCYDELNEPERQYESYNRILKRHPDSLSARLGKANAARALGKLDEAIQLYGDVAQAAEVPRVIWADHIRLSIVKARQTKRDADWKKIDEALDEGLSRKMADAVEASVLRAECALARGDSANARKLLEEAKAKNPTRVVLWGALATLAQRMKEPDEALRILDEADKTLTKPAEQAELRLARANFWVQRQNDEGRTELKKLSQRVEEDLQKFEARDRNRLLSGLAEANYRGGNPDEAGRLWRLLAKQDEYKADLRLRLMLFDLALQDNQEAEMTLVLEEVKKLEGGDGTFARHAEALRMIWLVKHGKVPAHRKKQTLAEAIRLLDQVQLARPKWTASLLARAEVEMLRGSADQAVASYRRAWDMGDRNPSLIRQLVDALRKQGKLKDADDLMKGLKADMLARADLERLAAQVALATQDPDRVIDISLKAVRADSRDYRDHLWLGRMLAASGKKAEEAERHLRKAVEMGGREPEPWVALFRFLVTNNRKSEARTLLGLAQNSIQSDRVALAMAQCHVLLDKPDDARKFYRQAVEKRPKDGATLSDYANFLLQRNELKEAEPILRRLLDDEVKLTPEESEWAHGRLAMVLAASGEYARFREALPHVGLKMSDGGDVQADESLVRSESLYMKRAAARVLSSVNLWQARDEAITRLEELDARQSLTPDDRFLLARLYENKNDWPKARAQLSKLNLSQESIQPDHLATYIRALLTHKEITQAVSVIARLEAMQKAKPAPAGPAILTELKARLHEAKGEGDKAIALLKERVAGKDADPQEVLLLISSLGRQKRFDEALELLEQVWKGCPPELAGGTSVALLRAGKTTEAQRKKVESLMKAAVEKNPKNITLKVQLGDVLDLRGDYLEAEQRYREALAADKDNPLALNNLAWLLALRAKKGDEALQLINRALVKSGPVAELLDTRGVIYYTMGKNAEALADLQATLKDAATSTRCFHLALVYQQQNDKESAARSLRQANELGLQASQLHPVEQVAHRKLDEYVK